jgi:hypothetical protein
MRNAGEVLVVTSNQPGVVWRKDFTKETLNTRRTQARRTQARETLVVASNQGFIGVFFGVFPPFLMLLDLTASKKTWPGVEIEPESVLTKGLGWVVC